MNRSSRLLVVPLLFILTLDESSAQDTLAAKAPSSFSSFGFQASMVSGIGLTFGRNMDNRFRFRVTGGLIAGEGETIYSTGYDLQFVLSNREDYQVFLGTGFGIFGGSERAPRFRLGFATGGELPLRGTRLYENLSAGAVIYYPTYFFHSGTLGFAGGVFLVYNF